MHHSNLNKRKSLFTQVNKPYSKYFLLFLSLVFATTTLVVLPQAYSSDAFVGRKTTSLPQNSIDDQINPLSLTQCSDTNFSASPTFDVGVSPRSVEIADLDGDGKLDIATANITGNNVSVLRNTSNATLTNFAPRVDFAVGISTRSIAVGDIDGDNKSDIITGGSNIVSVLRNTSSIGSVSFARSDFTVGSQHESVAVGDVDGDGKADLVVANNSNKTISVLRNTSSIGLVSFDGAVNFTVAANPYSIVMGDIDGDGKTDLAVANYDFLSSNFISVFKNISSLGSVNFDTPVNYAVGTNPFSVAMGDMDGDGKKDLASANRGTNTVSVLLNTSTTNSLSFASASTITLNGNPRSVKLSQIDNDGKLDLVVANASASTNNVSILRNTSSVSSIGFSSPLDFNVSSTSSSVAVADLDTDGKADVASVSSTTGGHDFVLMLKNTTVGSSINFLFASNFVVGLFPVFMATGDIDGDGKPDLATANQNSNNVSILRNTSNVGSVNFTRTDFAVGNLPVGVAIKDIDGDGKEDLVAVNFNDNNVSVLRNTSSIGSVSFAPTINFTAGTGPISVTIGDIDGDGKRDLAISNQSSNSISVLRNTSSIGSVSFEFTSNFAVGTAPISIAIGDVDGDGKADLAVVNQNAASVSVLRNTGSIGLVNFATAINFVVRNLPRAIVIEDFDGDSKLDLAVANNAFSVNAISVLRNISTIGTVNFAPRNDIAVGAQPISLTTGDFDGNGKIDIATANTGGTNISVLNNTSNIGSISFAFHSDFFVAFNSFAVQAADLDGNNKLDLAVARVSDTTLNNNVSILLNICTPSCPTISVNPTTLAGAAVGVAYNQTLTASGGATPYTFTVSAGALPTGLTLSSIGVLSGIPNSSGVFNFTIRATDANSCVGTRNYTLTVVTCSTITLSPSSLPNATVGVTYNQQLSANGGTTPYTFTLISGALPPGLTLSTSGLISGTATSTGNFNFTVRARDANGCTGNKAYTIKSRN